MDESNKKEKPGNKKLCSTASLPLRNNSSEPISRQISLSLPSKHLFNKKTVPPPLLRLNSDPKILPSSEESRQLEAFSMLEDHDYSPENGVCKLRSQLESGSVKCGQFLDPTNNIRETKTTNSPTNTNSSSSSSHNRSEKVKLLVKQKSLGRTLSTSVLRIKKKRSFWSNEKFKQ